LSFPTLAQLGWTPERADQMHAHPGLDPARVAGQHRGALDLIAPDGPRRGIVPGRLRHEAESTADLPAVGDWVAHEPETGVIQAVLPRRSGLARRSSDGRAVAQVLAANVDLALILGSLNQELNLRRLERFAALAADAGLDALIVLSKADLEADVPARVQEVRAALGGALPVLALSVHQGVGLDALEAWLRPGLTAVLLGSSGVGKTTLRNALVSGETAAQPTAPVRASDDRGRHTTTVRELVPLASGAVLIDTPGLRLPRLWESAGGLEATFADVDELARACRFSDCRHDGEPGCAVQAAIEDGRLEAKRLAAHRKLAREQAWLEERVDARARRERERRWRRINKDMRRMYRERGR
jgi:ribosome biogenesis GTPase